MYSVLLILFITALSACRTTQVEHWNDGIIRSCRVFSVLDRSRFNETIYNRSGSVEMSTDYVYTGSGQLIDGARKEYHDNGNLRMVVRMHMGVPYGTRKIFNYDGSLYQAIRYKDGQVIDGPSTSYYPNGQIEASVNIVEEKAQGPWVRYHPNGKIMETANYMNDTLQGEMRFYDSLGQLERVEIWKDNQPLE